MANETAAPPKSGKKGLILWILLTVLAIGAGAAAPWIIGAQRHDAHPAKKPDGPRSLPIAIPFDDVTVNLGEDKLTRYLRVKLMIAVEEPDTREVTELLTKQKPFLKTWLIGYLSDQTSQEVRLKSNVNRIRREIRDQFNAMLYPNGEEKIVDILFDMFVVQ